MRTSYTATKNVVKRRMSLIGWTTKTPIEFNWMLMAGQNFSTYKLIY